MEYIASQKKIAAILQKYGFNMKKSFGQNFLIDQNILRKIVKTAEIDQDTQVLEIGPGVGSLTQMLSEQAQQVYAFEIDYKLEPLLAETLAECANVEVIFQDFLKTDLTQWYQNINTQQPLKVIANLPYYITTPILEKLIVWYMTDAPHLVSATVMMQKEVAQRLAAKPNSKEYGSLSIFMQLFADVKTAFIVPKTVFVPAPNVDSAIVQLQFKRCPWFKDYEEADQFLQFVRLCFATRRKTVVNNLRSTFTSETIIQALQTAELSEKVRAEALTVADFYRLFQLLPFENQ